MRSGHLAPSTIEARGDSAIVAAEKWLSLSPADRDRTSIYASGRALRSAVNEAVSADSRPTASSAHDRAG